ncbi:MAG: VWA domain-containing protein, partial [Acidobacteriota bacterium]
MRPTRSIVSVAFLALLLAVSPLLAEAGPPDDLELFGETLDVRVVNLEIVVEQGGERVHGLGPDDFVLTVDGEPVPIEFFTEVRGGVAQTAAPAPADATVPALQPGQPVGTRYLVFVDDVFTIGPYRNRILRQLKNDLAFLQPEDSMAIVAFGGDTVDLLTTWTSSTRELESAFRKAEDRPSHGLRYRSREGLDDDFYFYSDRRNYGRYGRNGYLFTRAGERAFAEIGEVVDAAASTLRAFARADGRKVMLMLSGSWPPALPSVGLAQGTVEYAGNGRASARLFAPLIDSANRLGYSLYPIDVAGVETRVADASVSSFREANFVQRRTRDREWARESTFLDLAE